MFDEKKMSEAEVSLRLSLYLIRNKIVSSNVYTAIDGAQIQTGENVHFPIEDFLKENNCKKVTSGSSWQGTYKIKGFEYYLVIHSTPGKGDIVTQLLTGNTLRIESKKGPISKTKGSKEYPLLREGLGQLLTIEEYNFNDKLAVAVPDSIKFMELVHRWKDAPLIKKLELGFLLVNRDGSVKDINQILNNS